ncbi:hypothetical protein [Streptomyces goshikiensis]
MEPTVGGAVLLLVVVGAMGALVVVGPRWRPRSEEPERDVDDVEGRK